MTTTLNNNTNNSLNTSYKPTNTSYIYKYVINTIRRSNKSTKPYKYYLYLSQLYAIYPKLVEELVTKIPEYGCWKEIFVLLIANNDLNLNSFIYKMLETQINLDLLNFSKNKQISLLAKWIPRQQSSFDKKLNFVTNMCKQLYNNKYDNFLTARKAYRKTVSQLNSYLGTPEIKLCNKNLQDIDFNKVSSGCLQKHYKSFLKNNISKANLERFLFNKFAKLNFLEISELIFKHKDSDEFYKKVISDVFDINTNLYVNFIKNNLNINIKTVDVILDLSKTVYDSSLINFALSAAVIASKFNNNIIINAYKPYNIVLNNNLYDNIKKIISECNFFEKINLEAIEELKLTKSKKLLIVTSLDRVNTGNNIYYLDNELLEYYENKENKENKSIRDVRQENNIKIVKDILNNSQELKNTKFNRIIVIITFILGFIGISFMNMLKI